MAKNAKPVPAPQPAPIAADPLTQDPDVRLMMRAVEDEAGVFEQLVEKHRDRVVAILFHMVGDMDEAEDLAQEVFLRIYRSRKGYKPTARFSTWLFTIVNNLALNAIRDRKRKPRAAGEQGAESGTGRGMDHLAVAPSGASPSRQFAKSEMAEIVRAAVSQLSEDQRMAVMLNKFEDMNYRQIGEIMNKSEMAIKSLLSRARSTLREMLEPYLQSGQAP